MSLSEERMSLILDMKGQDSVKSLTAELELQKAQLKELKASFDAGQMSAGQFLQQQNALQNSIGSAREVLDSLKGQGGGGTGRGILGASYAIQDFTSQIQNGFTPALASIQNNIPQILMSFGVGAGFTGVISAGAVALGLMIPLIKKAFGAETQEDIEAVKKKAEEVANAIKAVHDAYTKMINKPSTAEEASAADLRATLEEAPNAERIQKAIERRIGRKAIEKEMTPEEMQAISKDKDLAAMTDEQLDAHASVGQAEGGIVLDKKIQDQLISDRLRARQRVDAIDRGIRQRIGERTVVDAAKAGPEGNAARRRLMEFAPDDIKREIEASSPDAIKKFDDENEAFNNSNEEWKSGKARRKAQKDKDSKEARERLKVRDAMRRQAIEAQEEADRDWNEGVARQDRIFEKGTQAAELVERTNKQRAAQQKHQQERQARAEMQRAQEQMERVFKDEDFVATVQGWAQDQVLMLHRRQELMRRKFQDQKARAEESMMGSGLPN